MGEEIEENKDAVKTKIHKKAMLAALETTLGVVTPATKNVGIHRQTHYLWMQKDKEYRKAVESMAEMCLDFVESKLLKQIKDESTAATIFYLKTKGRNRGYIERNEYEIKPVEQFTNEIDYSKLSDSALKELDEATIKDD